MNKRSQASYHPILFSNKKKKKSEVHAHEMKCSETVCGQSHKESVGSKRIKTLQRILQRFLGTG